MYAHHISEDSAYYSNYIHVYATTYLWNKGMHLELSSEDTLWVENPS